MRLRLLYGFLVVLPLLGVAQGATVESLASPLPPRPRSVTDFFRQLLVATPDEQARLLANKPPSTRAVLQRKLEEYRALPSEECELRLRALDLRSYLTILMRLPATNRTTRLNAVPEKDRQLVIDRLRQWDRLSVDLQKRLLESETGIALLVGGGLPGKSILPQLPRPNEDAMVKWQQIPADRRRAIMTRFGSSFDPAPAAPAAIAPSLTDPILEKIKLLPPTQRNICLSNFQKFAALSRPERDRFLLGAARWQQLPQAERQLARRLPPPPPGLELGGPPMPGGLSSAHDNGQ